MSLNHLSQNWGQVHHVPYVPSQRKFLAGTSASAKGLVNSHRGSGVGAGAYGDYRSTLKKIWARATSRDSLGVTANCALSCHEHLTLILWLGVRPRNSFRIS